MARTILVVDDEPQIRGLVRKVLEKNSYRVLDAEDGLQALSICEQSGVPIDLLLTDIVMPNLDGIELARRVSERTPQMRVLYMSGKCEMRIVEQDMQQRGFAFLGKPFSIGSLLESVQTALAAQRKGPDRTGSAAAASKPA